MSHGLLEHLFRHESGHLVAVLTRAFGVRRLDLVEDMVQSALMQAMQTWKQRGPPENPAAWLHRVAKNGILDALRREKIHDRALAHAGSTWDEAGALVDSWLEPDELPDSLLRMIFVCCHPALDRRSQLAITLKLVCGFGMQEIARALLITTEAAKKRVQRARAKLAQLRLTLDLPAAEERANRLGGVHHVLYLLFNEGYSSSTGTDPVRDDLCEEAARLCHLLCQHDAGNAASHALLSLMLFHAARLGARVDGAGLAILLEDQDRSRWDRGLMAFADRHLARANTGALTHFHIEAAIAYHHCHAASVAATPWSLIVSLYDRLVEVSDSPLYVLNRAIARGQAGDLREAHADLDTITGHPDLRDYYLLDCARARLYELAERPTKALASYRSALARRPPPHERELLKQKIRRLAR